MINFIIRLLILIDEKDETYDFILAIVDQLLKIVYYKLVKVTFNALRIAKVIIDVIV